jgi:hypothetical protein
MKGGDPAHTYQQSFGAFECRSAPAAVTPAKAPGDEVEFI